MKYVQTEFNTCDSIIMYACIRAIVYQFSRKKIAHSFLIEPLNFAHSFQKFKSYLILLTRSPFGEICIKALLQIVKGNIGHF